MRLHRFFGVHVDVLHEPARLVRADGQQREIERPAPAADLPEVPAVPAIGGEEDQIGFYARPPYDRVRTTGDQLLPESLIVDAEDAQFYEHKGLDYLGILRALYVNLRHGGSSRQGASTITQQVVKNLLLDPGKRYERKIREALLARRLEQELSKDEILELYLNHIYFGAGRYGIEDEETLRFFRIHERADVEHSAVCRALLDRLPEAERDEAIAAGEELGGALWNFLSGVEARASVH